VDRELWVKEISQHIINKKEIEIIPMKPPVAAEPKRKKEDRNTGFFKKFKF
jgi:hypothetical protein